MQFSIKEFKEYFKTHIKLNEKSVNQEEKEKKERAARQLVKVVCICKGIPLSKVLPGLKNSTTVEEVNRKTGTGSGGCQGERCGPRIKLLLKKRLEKDE